MKIEITQKVSFECAYIDFKESTPKLNAHKYILEATCSVEDDNDVGKLLTFEDFLKILKSVVPDNCFLKSSYNYGACYGHQSTSATYSIQVGNVYSALEEIGIPVESYPFDISTETLVNHFANKIRYALYDIPICRSNSIVELIEVRLKENNNSYATWHNN